MSTATQYSEPEWTLGERLAKARKVAGLTQEQMARELGIKESTLAAWEVGRNQPRKMMDTAVEYRDDGCARPLPDPIPGRAAQAARAPRPRQQTSARF